MTKKIEVFLRHCYYSKLQELPDRTRPHWFNKIKVFQNFKKTINPKIANYTIVYDEFYGSLDKTFLAREPSLPFCSNFIPALLGHVPRISSNTASLVPHKYFIGLVGCISFSGSVDLSDIDVCD